MSVTYLATAFNTTGSNTGTTNQWKEITASVNVGDLIVAFGICADSAGTGVGAISTQSGSTTAWRNVAYSNPTGSCGHVSGDATATATGSVTIRIQSPSNTTSTPPPMGVGLFIIPAGEWSGTPAYTTMANNDTDAKVSVNVATGGSNVLYFGGDWSAGAPGSSSTPAGAVEDTTYSDTLQYAVAVRHWAAQSAGTRTYGPTSPAGNDWGGKVIVVDPTAAPDDPGPGYSLLSGVGGGDLLLSGVGGGAERLSTLLTPPPGGSFLGFGVPL